MKTNTNDGGNSTETEVTNNGDLVIQQPLKKANPSKKTTSKKEAVSPTEETFKEYVKRGRTILRSLQKQRRNFLNLYIEMFENKSFTENEKQFNKYLKEFPKELGLSTSSHSKLSSIARNEGIVNNIDNLPASWGTLYELRDFNNDQIVDFIEQEDGITKHSTLEDVRAVIRPDSSEKVTSIDSDPYPREMYNFSGNVVWDPEEFDGETEEDVIAKFMLDIKRAEQNLLKHGLTAIGQLEIERSPETVKKVA